MRRDDVTERVGELAETRVTDGGDLEHAEAARFELGPHEVCQILGLGHVDLVQRDELRTVEERRLALGNGVRTQFGEDHVEVGQRVATGIERGAVEDVHQRGAALDVAEELEAQALALARALDEAGNVGDGEPDFSRLHDAEVGVQRGERVVGDLRPRGRDGRDQTGLAGRGEADQSHIGHGLQLELDVAFPSGGAEQREAGRLPLGVRQRRVAEPAEAAGGDDEAHAGVDHVDESLARGILHHRADRHGELERLAGRAGPVVAHAEAAVAAGAMRRVVVREEGGHLGVGDEHDVAAMPAVAAVGAGQRLELLTAHGHAAVAALAGAQMQRHTIDESDHAFPLTKRSGSGPE
nr:hypothetical protein GCM10025699_28560 [Microbacterium flavescens]